MIIYSLGWIHQHFEKIERTLFLLIVPRIHSTAVERLQLPETNCLKKSETLARKRKETHTHESFKTLKLTILLCFQSFFEMSAFKKKRNE